MHAQAERVALVAAHRAGRPVGELDEASVLAMSREAQPAPESNEFILTHIETVNGEDHRA